MLTITKTQCCIQTQLCITILPPMTLRHTPNYWPVIDKASLISGLHRVRSPGLGYIGADVVRNEVLNDIR